MPSEGRFRLDDGTFNHLVRVMRLQEGQEFIAFDGSGVEVKARLILDNRCRVAWGEVVERAYPQVELERRLTLYLSVVKGERFDWAVEKATELGVYRIVPLLSEFTAVRPSGKVRCDRWQRLAESATAQSGRVYIPEVSQPLTFEEAVKECSDQPSVIFVPNSAPWTPELPYTSRSWSLFIGPEGGFSKREVELALKAGMIGVGLGRRILRVETAALVALCLFGL